MKNLLFFFAFFSAYCQSQNLIFDSEDKVLKYQNNDFWMSWNYETNQPYNDIIAIHLLYPNIIYLKSNLYKIDFVRITNSFGPFDVFYNENEVYIYYRLKDFHIVHDEWIKFYVVLKDKKYCQCGLIKVKHNHYGKKQNNLYFKPYNY